LKSEKVVLITDRRAEATINKLFDELYLNLSNLEASIAKLKVTTLPNEVSTVESIMSEDYKVLGQVALAATTLTVIYTVPQTKKAEISSIVLCNRSAGAVTVRLAIAIAGEADAVKQYLHYGFSIAANTSLTVPDIKLGSGDVIRAYASAAEISVNVFGREI